LFDVDPLQDFVERQGNQQVVAITREEKNPGSGETQFPEWYLHCAVRELGQDFGSRQGNGEGAHGLLALLGLQFRRQRVQDRLQRQVQGVSG
jgi:hypothetical protein